MSRKQNVFFGSIPRELAPRLLIYYQKDAIIWTTYHGGDIVFGVLSGYVENNQLIFSYQHQNLQGYIKTGKCVSTPKWVNSKLPRGKPTRHNKEMNF